MKCRVFMTAGLVARQQTEAGLPAETAIPAGQPASCDQGKEEL